MSLVVLPGHFRANSISDNGARSDIMLRPGEVQAIYFPEDAQNISKKFVEYDVFVQYVANKTAVFKIYTHVLGIDDYGSLADFDFATFRADPSATNKAKGRQLTSGLGAKVLLLCISAQSNNAVIIGGLRDAKSDPDTKEDGHHRHARFNGVDLLINKDGELTVTYQGAQKLDGSPEDGVDTDTVGTYIKFDRNGGVTISDANGYNSIVLDQVNGRVQVVSQNEMDVTSPLIRHGGQDAQSPGIRGDDWQSLMSDILDQLIALTVGTAVGPSSPPLNVAQLQALKARLGEPLSDTVFLK